MDIKKKNKREENQAHWILWYILISEVPVKERSTLTAAATPGNRGRKWQTTEDIPISEDFSQEDNIFLRQLSSQSLLLFFLFSFYFMDLPQRRMTYWKMIQDLKNPNNLNLCSSRYSYGSLTLILRNVKCLFHFYFFVLMRGVLSFWPWIIRCFFHDCCWVVMVSSRKLYLRAWIFFWFFRDKNHLGDCWLDHGEVRMFQLHLINLNLNFSGFTLEEVVHASVKNLSQVK